MSSQLDCENSEVRIRKETEIGLGLISQMKSIVPHLVPIDDLVVIVDKNYKKRMSYFMLGLSYFAICHLYQVQIKLFPPPAFCQDLA